MAAHGLHDGLQRHVPAFGMIHGKREVRSAERLHQEARARRYAGYSVEAALATFSALRHWNLALVKGRHHVAIFGQRLARSTCPAHCCSARSPAIQETSMLVRVSVRSERRDSSSWNRLMAANPRRPVDPATAFAI